MSTNRSSLIRSCETCGHLSVVHHDRHGCMFNLDTAQFCECATTKSEIAGQQQVSLSVETLRVLLTAVDPEVATGDLYTYSQQHIASARAALATALEAP